jgi:hypothetical protein
MSLGVDAAGAAGAAGAAHATKLSATAAIANKFLKITLFTPYSSQFDRCSRGFTRDILWLHMPFVVIIPF